MWNKENRARIEKLASDSSVHLRIVTEADHFHQLYFVNGVLTTEQEAAYFNFLRYLNDGEYIPVKNDSRYKNAVNRIPFFFEDASWSTHAFDPAIVFANADLFKPLFVKKLELLGVNSNFLDIDYMFEHVTVYSDLIADIWNMLDARSELEARYRQANFARILACENEDPVKKRQIDLTYKLIDYLFTNEFLSVDEIKRLYDSKKDTLGIRSYVGESCFKPEERILSKLKYIEDGNLKKYCPRSASPRLDSEIITRSAVLTEIDLTIRAIHQYNAANREKIEKASDGVAYREMILATIPDVESSKMTLAALKSEFKDFRKYIDEYTDAA